MIQRSAPEIACDLVDAFEAGDREPGLSPRETLQARIVALIESRTVRLPVNLRSLNTSKEPQ